MLTGGDATSIVPPCFTGAFFVSDPSAESKRCPPAFGGLQVNVCHNLRCGNFGVPPLARVDRGRSPKIVDTYVAVSIGRGVLGLRCKLCGEHLRAKSNQAVHEELMRMLEQARPADHQGCATSECVNFALQETTPASRYQKFGTSACGSRRYRCKACQKTFTVGASATRRQRVPETNALIFRLLINKSPMRRICEVADIHPAVLYQRIDFIHRQCVRVAASIEDSLKTLSKDRFGIAVDRQEHTINWSSQFDRRVTQVSAVASADVDSGFVLGMHLDYDPRFDAHDLDLAARQCGDPDKDPAFRRYARLFLPFETDTAADDALPSETRLPSRGVRVHSQYTLYGHFHFLRARLPTTATLHFYMDRDPGMGAGCMSAFGQDVKTGRVETFLVKIDKSMMVDTKKRSLAASRAELDNAMARFPGRRRYAVARQIVADLLADATSRGLPVMQRWIKHPLPNMGEPDKHVCYLSDRGDLSADALADFILDVRMHPLDRFFMQVRRRLSVLERPIVSASSAQRRWHGYAVYNPQVVARLLETFRVVYNVNLAGADGATPAMRLGLARQPMTLQDIIDYLPDQSSTKA